MCYGGNKGSDAAEQARVDEQARQERIRQGTQSINNTFDGQFTDQFFDGRRKAYLDYANPQFDRQLEDTRRQLAFSLDRSGLTDSSVRAAKERQLDELIGTRRREIADQALGFANEARNNVESARSDLTRTLASTGDASGAAQSAVTRAQMLTQPQAFSPLSQLFADFTNTLGAQANLERTASLTGTQPRYNTGLFGANNRAVQVIPG